MGGFCLLLVELHREWVVFNMTDYLKVLFHDQGPHIREGHGENYIVQH